MTRCQLTCITCPRGCTLEVEVGDGRVASVKGNGCKRGIIYAATEILHPERVLTGTVYVPEKDAFLPVRTDRPMPREQLRDGMNRLRRLRVALPVDMGDVLIENIVPGVHVVASCGMK